MKRIFFFSPIKKTAGKGLSKHMGKYPRKKNDQGKQIKNASCITRAPKQIITKQASKKEREVESRYMRWRSCILQEIDVFVLSERSWEDGVIT